MFFSLCPTRQHPVALMTLVITHLLIVSKDAHYYDIHFGRLTKVGSARLLCHEVTHFPFVISV